MSEDLSSKPTVSTYPWGRALAVGGLVGWLLVVFCVLASQTVFELGRTERNPYFWGMLWNQFGLFVFFGVPIALSLSFVFGLPVAWLAMRFGLTKWWQALALGSLVGILISIAWPTAGGILGRLGVASFFGAIGALSGLAAWATYAMCKTKTREPRRPA